MRYQLSLLALAVLLLPSVCKAVDLGMTSHASIERFIDQETVLVGWLDLSQLDLDELERFAAGVDLDHLPQVPPPIRQLQQALVQLEVDRVYWISSLAEIYGGPKAILIPAQKTHVEMVALLLRSATSDGQSVVVDGTVVLAGEDSIVTALQQRSGAPNQHLANALKQSNSANGIVTGASSESLRAISALLTSQTTSGSEVFGKFSQLVPDLKNVSLHGYLPPSTATFEVRMGSADSASKLATLLNAESVNRLRQDAASLRFSASESIVTINTTSLEESTKTVRSIVKLFQPARARANRKATMNNHKQIALGLHIFHDHHRRFPPQRLVDEQGSPLHSWRVLILPHLGEEQLYSQFRLDEPWDSKHNIKLAAQMPAVFRSPGDSAEMTAAGKTRFVAPLTDSSMFGHRGDSTRIRDITDGTSNTLMVVQTTGENAVTWTRPGDLVLTDDRPVFEQIAGDADGFTACTCDGGAHHLDREFSEEILRTMLSMAGGEILEWP